MRPALVSLVVSAAVTLLRPHGSLGLREAWLTTEGRFYWLFFCGMVVGIPFSVYRPGSFDAVVLEYPANMAFFALFLVHVSSADKLRRVALTLMFAGCSLTLFAFLGGTFAGGRYDIGTQMYDPNDTAFVEVSLLAFALWVVAGPFGVVLKAIAAVTALGGTLLILLTASRGGLVALLTFLVLFLCLRVPAVGKTFKVLLVASLLLTAMANLGQINVERLQTLNSIEDDYNFQEGGRIDIWQRGWRLFLANPLTGVGVEGFTKAIGDMRARDGERPVWQAAHSAYLLVLTETGVAGSIPFCVLIVSCLITLNRLRRIRSAPEDADVAGLAGLLLVGFCAQLVAAAFLSQAYSMFFTLVFAMSATLKRLATPALTAQARPSGLALHDAAAITWRGRVASRNTLVRKGNRPTHHPVGGLVHRRPNQRQ